MVFLSGAPLMNLISILYNFRKTNPCLPLSNKDRVQLSLLETQINEELSEVLIWCNVDKLNINLLKSNYLVILPKLNNSIPKMCITVNNSVLSTGENIIYLGINIDPHLNFLTHIKSIEHKTFRYIGIMHKLKPFLPKPVLLKIYYTIIHHYFRYALPAWRSTYPTYMSKLCILQNKAIKHY